MYRRNRNIRIEVDIAEKQSRKVLFPMAGPIEEWFHVTFDEDSIRIHIDIPERKEIRE